MDEHYYLKSKQLTFYRKASILKKVSNLVFAGRGNIGRENCGKHYGFFSCKRLHTIKHRNNYCYKLTCPICFHKALTRTSERVLKRFKGIYKAYKQLGIKLKIKHYSFNTRWVIKNENDLATHKKMLTNILNKYNFNGLLVYHEYRKTKVSKEQWDQGIRPNLFYHSHFHVIGWGWLPEYNKFLEKHGFTYTNITEKNRYLAKKRGWDLKYYPEKLGKQDIYLCVRYLLSHASFKNNPKAHSYYWLGNMLPQRTKRINEIKKTEPILCEACEERDHYDSMIYKLKEPKFTKKEIGNCISEYELQTPFDFNESIYLVKKIHTYDLKIKPKYIPQNYKNYG